MTRETETSWGGWRLPRIQISGKTRRKKRKKNDTRLAGVDSVAHVYRSQERQGGKRERKMTETSWGGWRWPRIQISGKTREKEDKET